MPAIRSALLLPRPSHGASQWLCAKRRISYPPATRPAEDLGGVRIMTSIAPYPREPTLFRITLAVAVLLWLLLIVGTLGVALLYVLIGCVIYLFVQSGFIAYIKGNAVEITPQQYPQLYAHYASCCHRIGLSRSPRLYLLQSEGMVNALAARFLNTHYVVLYSSIVDALDKHPASLRFYMGHELCHVARGHLKWAPALWPARLLPLLGPAYSRAQESSCDRYGLACCASPLDAIRAMAVMASGPQQWSRLNVRAFRDQSQETGRFWMAFHELTGGYPWLCKRVGRVAAWADNAEETFPRRNPLAYVLALFVPNLGLGAGGGPAAMLIVIVVVGVLAAVAIPAYQDYTVRAQVAQSMQPATQISKAIEDYVDINRSTPTELTDIGLIENFSEGAIARVVLGEDGQFVLVYGGAAAIEGATIEFVPYLDDDKAIRWDCMGGTLPARYRPGECKPAPGR
jgi:Zn-dependent protease with chaperone function